MSRAEQHINIVRENSRQLMWAVSDDMSKMSMTPDLALKNTKLIAALVHTLRHLAFVSENEWLDFDRCYRQLHVLVDLSNRPYGRAWQDYCVRVSAQAEKDEIFGRPLAKYLPLISSGDYKKIGIRHGYISETKSLLGKPQFVVNA